MTAIEHAPGQRVYATLRVGSGHDRDDAQILGLLRWNAEGHLVADAAAVGRCARDCPPPAEHELNRQRVFALAGGTIDDDTPVGSTGVYHIADHALACVGVFRTADTYRAQPMERTSGRLYFGQQDVYYARRVTTETPGAAVEPALLRSWHVAETVDAYGFDGHRLEHRRGPTHRAPDTVDATAAPEPTAPSAPLVLATPGGDAGVEFTTALSGADVQAHQGAASGEQCSAVFRLTPGDEVASARELRLAAGAVLLPASSWHYGRLRSHATGCAGVNLKFGDHPSVRVAVIPHLRDHRLIAIADITSDSEGACDDHGGIVGVLRWTADGRLTTEAVDSWSNSCTTDYGASEHRLSGVSLIEVPGGQAGTGAGSEGGLVIEQGQGARLASAGHFDVTQSNDVETYPRLQGAVFYSHDRVYYARTDITPADADAQGSEWRQTATQAESVTPYVLAGANLAVELPDSGLMLLDAAASTP